MDTIKHILVDMDPAIDYQPGLYKAIHLAQVTGASIELFLACYDSHIVTHYWLDEARIESAIQAFLGAKKRWLDSYRSEVIAAGVPVTSDVRWHKPLYEGVIQKANECKADVVYKSTQKHGVLEKIFFTPDDWQLLKACPQPLWLAKNKARREIKHVLVAIDPVNTSGKPVDLDAHLLTCGARLSSLYGASQFVAHCYEPLAFEIFKEIGEGFTAHNEGLSDHEQYIQAAEAHHRNQFESTIDGYEIDADKQFLLQGYPDICLPELVAMKDIDLIIMGTTYRTGLLGSTAEKVLDKVNCDVLAIKPESFVTPVH